MMRCGAVWAPCGCSVGTQSAGLTGLGEPNIDWVKLANGYGIEAETVTDYDGLAAALRHGLQVDGPYLIAAVF